MEAGRGLDPDERSLVKEVDRLTAPYRAFVEKREARFNLIARGLNLFGIPMNPERMQRAFTVRGIERFDDPE